MTQYLDLLQNPLFWRQLAVGVVILIILVILKSAYRKLKWTILLLIFGGIILLFYGQFFFTTYSTEGERTEVEQLEQSAWEKISSFAREWFRFE